MAIFRMGWKEFSIPASCMMYSRPGRGESEEDLLKIQTEFLSRGTNPAAGVGHSTQGRDSSAELREDDNNTCEKRPHERDVVQLQGISFVWLRCLVTFVLGSWV